MIARLTLVSVLAAASVSVADEPIRFSAGWTSFLLMGDSTMSRVEFYVGLNRTQLVPRFEAVTVEDGRTFEGYFISPQYELRVLDSQSVEVASTLWPTKNLVPDSAAAATQDYVIVDGQQLVMDPGEYTFVVTVTDRNSRRSGQEVYQVSVPKFPRAGLSISQLEFALSITPANPGETFVRGNVRVLPNPYSAYSRTLDTLLTDSGDTLVRPKAALYLPYYAEVYGVADTMSAPVDAWWTISDASGDTVRGGDPVRRTITGGSGVIIDRINVTTLRAGRYRLSVSVSDATGTVAASSREFYIIGGPVAPVSPFAGRWDEEASGRARDEILYVATNEELRRYDGLPLDARPAFLVSFWEKHDPTPGTAKNEFREEHYRRMAHANATFSDQFREGGEGWRTDMGRIYIKYGPPSEIQRYAVELGVPSFEIWRYDNVQGGVVFVFADERQTGVYKIVHSTARGERTSIEWEERVRRYLYGGQ